MTRQNWIGLVALFALSFFGGLAVPYAWAQSGGSAASFQHSATTTKSRVGGAFTTTGAARYRAIRCWVNSATVVRFGSCEDLDATHGYPICTTAASCEGAAMTWETNNLCALAASGTVVLDCTTLK